MEKKTWKRGAKYKSHIVGYGRTSKGTVTTGQKSIRTSVETMTQTVIGLLDAQIPDWEEAMVELVYYDKVHKIFHTESKLIQKGQTL